MRQAGQRREVLPVHTHGCRVTPRREITQPDRSALKSNVTNKSSFVATHRRCHSKGSPGGASPVLRRELWNQIKTLLPKMMMLTLLSPPGSEWEPQAGD